MKRIESLRQALASRILILDGAMGTMLQRHGLDEAGTRGQRFAAWHRPLRGNHDVLNLTRPDIVRHIHEQYLEAGADLIETNTFSSTAIAQTDYGLADLVPELNREGARLARQACETLQAETGRCAWVIGVLGPTNRTASLSPDVQDPGKRNVEFDQLAEDYGLAARSLLEGGADVLMVETIFDTLNAKAALYAIRLLQEERGEEKVPLLISGTITDASGRLLAGQTVEAFWTSVAHARPLAVGLNCALGAAQMRPWLSELAAVADCLLSAHPNAGLPNPLGGYDETPEAMALTLREFASQGLLNMVGGCCGTTPETIAAIAQAMKGLAPRQTRKQSPTLRLAGLEPFLFRREQLFVNIGERTNVTGSARFRALVESNDFVGALAVARQQVESGAQILDINLDEGLLDSQQAMTTFLRLLQAEPDIARIPWMIDSSNWSVLRAGLANIQGKPIVNSISLKEGEDSFLQQAREIRRFGAAVVVMAFDEKGQAETFERKMAILTRSHHLLTQKVAFPPEDIIFDPNIFAVATGLEGHNRFGLAFLQTVTKLKQEFPLCRTSGGISNFSFSFRGNNAVREAMHSVFLYHAVRAGLDMGIVNAGQLPIFEEIDCDLRQAIEDILFDRGNEVLATERLLAIAPKYQAMIKEARATEAPEQLPLVERLVQALLHGKDETIEKDVLQAAAELGGGLAVIEGPLMAGMNRVGDLFGAGALFLPQVVKSARVMKKAVATLQPMLSSHSGSERKLGRILLATVRGDVHDIGKNIVGVVLQCNGFEVIDLGVMVPCEHILAEAVRLKVDAIGLSGLITPSLEEMCLVAAEMERRGFQIPLLIGGATTSTTHTALRIHPLYSHGVVHVADASRAAGVARNLLDSHHKAAFLEKQREEYERRQRSTRAGISINKEVTLAEARQQGAKLDWTSYQPPKPNFLGRKVLNPYPMEDLLERIDWTPLFQAWELPGTFPAILDHPIHGQQARELWTDAGILLREIQAENLLEARAVLGLFPAHRREDDIVIDLGLDGSMAFPQLRQQLPKSSGKAQFCLADFLAPEESGKQDYLGLFAVSAGFGMEEATARFKANHDEYRAMLLQCLGDRLAEALAERLHEKTRQVYWGYAADERFSNQELISECYRGIRPAPGYPACPDHRLKRLIWQALKVETSIGLNLTESCAMWPSAAVSGFYFSHPQAHYFGVGRIGLDQLQDYAARWGERAEESRRWLAQLLPLPEQEAATRR